MSQTSNHTHVEECQPMPVPPEFNPSDPDAWLASATEILQRAEPTSDDLRRAQAESLVALVQRLALQAPSASHAALAAELSKHRQALLRIEDAAAGAEKSGECAWATINLIRHEARQVLGLPNE